MTAVKCYYEVLEVSRDASDDELKKSYRKLALRWHPDKNMDKVEEAKAQFQLIQQAFEVLSDPQERAWYDEHREAILKGGLGGDYEDDSFDVFPYFTSACFKGFGDDEKGFYTVYREVFGKIAAEESEFYAEGEESESDFEIPSFGTSTSDYDEVVHEFYGFWQSFTTRKSYAWMDEYDTRQGENRRVVRAMEKENKKVREKARKARNEQIRTLVAFVRKRDKRIEAHKQVMAERAKENALKVENNRKKQLAERKKLLEEAKSANHLKMDDMEGVLKEIESNLNAEFGEQEESLDEDEPDGLFCVACNKNFRTEKAFANHENSKKHKENVAVLKASMQEEEEDFMDDEDDDEDKESTESRELTEAEKAGYQKLQEEEEDDDPNLEEEEEEAAAAPAPSSKKKKNKKKPAARVHLDSTDVAEEDLEELGISKKQRKKKEAQAKQQQQAAASVDSDKDEPEGAEGEEAQEALKQPAPKSKGKKAKAARKAEKVNMEPVDPGDLDVENTCVKCKSVFPTRNKLFEHFKKTGHSVPLSQLPAETKKEKKRKK